MKKIILTITIAATLAAASCKDWLDLPPRTESQAKELLTTQKGFRDALIGAYIDMKSRDIYGAALTWETIEYLAQHWTNYGDNPFRAAILSYNYTNADVLIKFDNIYAKLYSIIAQTNVILETIDDKRGVFEGDNYAIVKGEALALRAYCHMDLLRLFGPVPALADAEAMVLPYVKTVSKLPHPYSTFNGYMTELLGDLTVAEGLMKDVDPICGTYTGSDTWLNSRQLRLNYYAVLALKARAHMWQGDATNIGEAKRYADMVIGATTPDGAPVFRLGGVADFNAQDYMLSPEHIFALKDDRMERVYTDNMLSPGLVAAAFVQNFANFYIFGTTGTTTDIRFNNLWKEHPNKPNTMDFVTSKYQQNPNEGYRINQLPLLRLSEMYLISAEAAGFADGTTILNDFKSTRGAGSGDWTSDAALQTEILKEYDKEFYAEGYMFYADKRVNSQGSYGSKLKADVYVLPRPQREINFTNNN